LMPAKSMLKSATRRPSYLKFEIRISKLEANPKNGKSETGN
jgi:hypothetical protein